MTAIHRLSTAAALLCAACNGNDVFVGSLSEVTTLKAIPNRDLDILFVVDNSPSMTEEQQSLATNFPLMMDALSTLDDGLPNLHIGVVTSDMGTSGSQSLMPGPSVGSGPGGCSGFGDDGRLVPSPAVTGNYIEDVAIDGGGRQINYTGPLRDAFGGMALVGADGCGFEQHLHAMKRGLENVANNAGFLRDDANLAIVIIGDEDDCSVGDTAFFGNDTAHLGPLQSFRCFQFGVECAPDDPTTPGPKTNCAPRATSPYVDDIQPFVDYLVNLKGDPRKVLVSAVVGDPAPVEVILSSLGSPTPIPTLSPSCTYSGPSGAQTADPAVRLATFLDAFPGRSQLTSICNPDLSDAVSQIGDSAKKLIGDPCVDTSNLADTSEAPGVQPVCEVVDIRDSDPTPVSLPTCGSTSGDCYELVADAVACPKSADHLRLRIQRTTAVFDDTWTHVRCQPRS
jgi:hypothetical protein